MGRYLLLGLPQLGVGLDCMMCRVKTLFRCRSSAGNGEIQYQIQACGSEAAKVGTSLQASWQMAVCFIYVCPGCLWADASGSSSSSTSALIA